MDQAESRCDRCGGAIFGPATPVVVGPGPSHPEPIHSSVCASCVGSFSRWLGKYRRSRGGPDSPVHGTAGEPAGRRGRHRHHGRSHGRRSALARDVLALALVAAVVVAAIYYTIGRLGPPAE